MHPFHNVLDVCFCCAGNAPAPRGPPIASSSTLAPVSPSMLVPEVLISAPPAIVLEAAAAAEPAESFVQKLVEKADEPGGAVMEAASPPAAARSLACTVCLDNDVDTVFVPCGHTCCEGCVNKMKINGRQSGRGLRCHICRASIEHHCAFYLP